MYRAYIIYNCICFPLCAHILYFDTVPSCSYDTLCPHTAFYMVPSCSYEQNLNNYYYYYRLISINARFFPHSLTEIPNDQKSYTISPKFS